MCDHEQQVFTNLCTACVPSNFSNWRALVSDHCQNQKGGLLPGHYVGMASSESQAPLITTSPYYSRGTKVAIDRSGLHQI